MANDNAQPLLVAGKLPKDCYTDLDEFVQDLSKVLALPLDAVAVIQGAKGEKGDRGEKGSIGPTGPASTGTVKKEIQVSIPDTAKYVEFPVFFGWQSASYGIRFNGRFDSPGAPYEDFDPVNGIVGPGVTVEIHNPASISPTHLRHYFTFAGGITETPNEHFMLQITYIS